MSSSSSLQSIDFKSLTIQYFIPLCLVSVAIIPVFRDMMVKSFLQKEEKVPKITIYEGIKSGCRAAPTVGLIVGTQMFIQEILEKKLDGGETNKNSFTLLLASSVIVGGISAPILAVFNGQTMGVSVKDSIRKFSLKQACTITLQETAFVAGLSAGNQCTTLLNRFYGEKKANEYLAAFIAGATGSLVGHPANTALTRWQSGLQVDSSHAMKGSLRKARAVGLFSVLYKMGKEAFNTSLKEKEIS